MNFTTESWEDKFNNMFLESPWAYEDWGMPINSREVTVKLGEVKAFIRSELEKQAQEHEALMLKNIGMLRQWLNEDRITDHSRMVTNEELKHWLL